MLVVAVISLKGGVGKTAVTVSLAGAAERAGRSTLIGDVDPQSSATFWAHRRQGRPPAVLSARATMLADLVDGARAAGAEYVFIDTPGRARRTAAAAARAADLVVIPIRPALVDLETTFTTVDLVKANAEPRAGMVALLNGVPPRGPREAQAREALSAIDLPVLAASIGHRAAIEYAFTLGLTAAERERGGKAALEIEQVYREIVALLGPDNTRGEEAANGT